MIKSLSGIGLAFCLLMTLFPLSLLSAAGDVQGVDTDRLVRDLGDPDPLVRERAAEALSSVRPASEEAVRALIGALADPDPYVAGKASAALAALGPRSVDALAAALRSESADVRWGAVSAFAKLGPDAGSAVPGLIEAVKDKDPDVRWGARCRAWEISARARKPPSPRSSKPWTTGMRRSAGALPAPSPASPPKPPAALPIGDRSLPG